MRTLRAFAFILSIAALPVLVGCQGSGRIVADTPALQAERATLTKFIGAWDYEGWHEPADGPRRITKGKAAGVEEHSHFVMLDTNSEITEGGTSRKLQGSILFSVEPGVGLGLTAWSDDSPVVRQFDGKIESNGNRFVFKSVPAPGNPSRVQLNVVFSSADRWTAEFTRSGKLVASYTFVRAR